MFAHFLTRISASGVHYSEAMHRIYRLDQYRDECHLTVESVCNITWIASRRTSGSNTFLQSGRIILLVPHSMAIFAASENGDFSAPKTIARAIRACPAINA